MKQQQVSRGRKNWMKLKNIILNKNLAHKQKDKKMSVFAKEANVSEGKLITHYRYKDSTFVQAAPQPIFKELVTFQSDIDATGKWIWEAEEIAAYYFLHEYQKFLKRWQNRQKTNVSQNFRVLQLGAGCSGLAGISIVQQISKNRSEVKVELILSDGLIENIEYLNLNLQLNGLCKQRNCGVYLKWGTHSICSSMNVEDSYKRSFDLIVICDCLYFTDFHKELISQVDYYLSQAGSVVLVNPSRGQSMQLFLQLSQKWSFYHKFHNFEQQRYQNECNKISKDQTFDKEKNVFYFIELQRKEKGLQNI